VDADTNTGDVAEAVAVEFDEVRSIEPGFEPAALYVGE
jgi:hypothetical protein